MASELIASVAPVTRRVRAFFAPVNRVSGVATTWDPSGIAGFEVWAPPVPWLDLGWCAGFERESGTKVAALLGGAPGVAVGQVRTEIEASVSVAFESWGKLERRRMGGAEWRWRRCRLVRGRGLRR